jgi:hypothetical protein
MYYIDAYADIYQKLQGFEICLLDKDNKILDGYLSFEQSTRSTYDIAMRDATIDGLVTMDDITKLQVSQLFYKKVNPSELFIIQAVNKSEQQTKSKNINAIKQNSFVSLQRMMYNKEQKKEVYTDVYTDIVSFVSIQNKDQKNFAAGVEDNTVLNIQIPKKDIVKDIIYDVKNLDRIIIEDVNRTRKDEVKIESIDAYGVPGVLRIYGTFDTRTGD